MYLTEKNIVYEWSDFFEDLEILVDKLKAENLKPLFPDYGFDGIYGIPAGGLVLATCLHYQLKLPLLLAPTPKTLIIDDIADSGKTLSHYVEKGNFSVTLFYNRISIVKPNIWLREKFNNLYVIFPWEGEDDRLAR